MAALAEESKSPHGLAQVAAQQLRSVEVGAKVAGTGGYAAQRSLEGNAGAQTFSVNILFSSGQKVSISSVPQGLQLRRWTKAPGQQGALMLKRLHDEALGRDPDRSGASLLATAIAAPSPSFQIHGARSRGPPPSWPGRLLRRGVSEGAILIPQEHAVDCGHPRSADRLAPGCVRYRVQVCLGLLRHHVGASRCYDQGPVSSS